MVHTDRRQDDADVFKLDDYDDAEFEVGDADDDDTDDYEDHEVGKKRKRPETATSNTDPNHSKQTKPRLKTEGGEAFILDESTSHLSQQQSSRVIGTFGRRKSDCPPARFNTLTMFR